MRQAHVLVSMAVTAGAALVCLGLIDAAEPPETKIWTFDRLDNIGGVSTSVLGHPKVIEAPMGKAVQFNGVDDALFINEHPLAGAQTFTFEAIFRPDAGGAPEQRWFHLAEQDPKTGADTDTRFLFEIRVINNQWCLDAFVHTPTVNRAILNREQLYPLDTWHAVAQVFDGKQYSSYVDGELQGKAEIHFEPEGPGHTSVGVRINKEYYFKGAVHLARFTRRALSPEEFLKVPDAKSIDR
jgi:hypothetical protein